MIIHMVGKVFYKMLAGWYEHCLKACAKQQLKWRTRDNRKIREKQRDRVTTQVENKPAGTTLTP